jgi:hypothetical protein
MLATVANARLTDAGTDNPRQCLVELPPHLTHFFCEEGYLSTVHGEQRSIARLRVRSEAIIVSHSMPFFATYEWRELKIYTKDLSKTGAGILSHIQHWPGETFWLLILGRRLLITVRRCRRLGPHCFEVGGSIETVIGKPAV